jgi:trk system potassium uptake protein
MRNNIAVIGLGLFGSTVALELSRVGFDVLGIDLNATRTNAVADQIAQAVIADAREERVLRELGLHEMHTVVVAIGEDIEASILATLATKNLERPKVWVKAINHNHHRILEKLGADHIVHPEHEMGLRIARTLIYPEVIDYISLGDDQFIAEVRASERLAGKTLSALHLHEHDVRCLLIKHAGLPRYEDLESHHFAVGDQIVFTGTLGHLKKISRYL